MIQVFTKAVEITRKDAEEANWSWRIADTARRKLRKGYSIDIASIEALEEMIKSGKVAVMSMNDEIDKRDVLPYLDNGFEVLMIGQEDFRQLKSHYSM